MPILHLKVANLPMPHLEGGPDFLPTRPIQLSPLCISLGFTTMMMGIHPAPGAKSL